MKRIGGMVLVLGLLLCLGGCYLRAGESLYSLPQAPEEYYDLQAALNEVLDSGAEYAAPVAGNNRQSTQSVDLDADGRMEVVAFFRREADGVLEVYIFDQQGESYIPAAVIEGPGSAIDSVEYVQLDDAPGLELIVGWQVSESAQYMGVYSLRDWRVTELMSASYSEYRTVNLDDNNPYSEVFLIRFDPELRTGVAQLYAYDGAQMEKMTDAALSTGVEALRRIVAGRIEGGTPAVFVAGTYGEGGIVTDVFTVQDGDFVNISSTDGSGVSSQTVRNYYVYATDVDMDGALELPQPRELPVWPPDAADTFWLIDWCGIRPDGSMLRKQTTFHNYAAGWYLTIPQENRDAMTVYRQASQSGLWSYVFADWDSQAAEPLFIVHAFGGDDRDRRSAETGFVRLGEVGDVVYMAELLDKSIQPEDLVSRFHPVITNWNSGEM